MSMNGIDISHWQNGIDVSKIPCDFVIIKATQGTGFVDNCCNKFYQAAKKAGKKLGLYHFADGKSTGKQEADHFIKNIKGYIGEAILVLDWEADALKKGPSYAKEFLDRVFEVTGVRPLIYMSKSVCREYDWTSVVAANYGLWMAQYANKNATGYQTNPWTDAKGMGAFKSYAIHQYSSAGRLTGFSGNLDLNIAYMTADAWNKYAKSAGYVAPIVPGLSGSSNTNSYIVGKDYTLQANMFVRKTAGGEKEMYANLTADAKSHAIKQADGTAVLKKGTTVTCKNIKTVDNAIWMQIPSGWVCGIDTSGKVYVK